MSKQHEIRVPDIGDFEAVDVIEVLVQPGDQVEQEQSLITLESDKASLEVPAPEAGKVVDVLVSVGDKVAEGTAIVILETQADAAAAEQPRTPEQAPSASSPTADRPPETASAPRPESPASAAHTGKADISTDLVVLGSGPGGYAAAFRAADLGLDVTLVERYPVLGGVCLNVGCIPSKALLHAARVIREARDMSDHGVRFGEPKIDVKALREWKDGVVAQLTNGLTGLAKKRKVEVIQGHGEFTGSHELTIEDDEGKRRLHFEQAIIAAGSQSAALPGAPEDDRIMDSTGALQLPDIPSRLLIIGGGIIGLEMATAYSALGSRVTVVEMTDALMPGADPALVKPLRKRLEKDCEAIYTGTKVSNIKATKKQIRVAFEGKKAPESAIFDRVLVAIGRRPNGHRIGAEQAGVKVNEQGFIPINEQMRTSVPHIFAIGDIAGEPQLAHKATHQGHLAAEVAAGEKRGFDNRVVPSVAYTDPEVAWVGVTETEAKERGLEYDIGAFPWSASGRALGQNRPEGLTRLIFERGSQRIIGAGIVGPHAGELIAECAHAIEMGSEAEDIALTIHPHPTLSETVGLAAEAFTGTLTDLYIPRKRGRG